MASGNLHIGISTNWPLFRYFGRAGDGAWIECSREAYGRLRLLADLGYAPDGMSLARVAIAEKDHAADPDEKDSVL